MLATRGALALSLLWLSACVSYPSGKLAEGHPTSLPVRVTVQVTLTETDSCFFLEPEDDCASRQNMLRNMYTQPLQAIADKYGVIPAEGESLCTLGLYETQLGTPWWTVPELPLAVATLWIVPAYAQPHFRLDAKLLRGGAVIWSDEYEDYAHSWMGWVFLRNDRPLGPPRGKDDGVTEVRSRLVAAALADAAEPVRADCAPQP